MRAATCPRRAWPALVLAAALGLSPARVASAQTTETPVAGSGTTSTTTTPQTPPPTQPVKPPVVQAPMPKPKMYGRISFYADQARITPDGIAPTTYGDAITSVTFRAPDADGEGLDYGLELRQARAFGRGRDDRLSIYDAYAGARLLQGRLLVRGGQIWLTDLGGLGLVAGAQAEYRQKVSTSSRLGRLRAGVFAGGEPSPYDAGIVTGMKKFGGYAVLEGHAGRRHTVGYVQLRHGGLLERSVVSVSNFIPTPSHIFVYQSAEIDMSGPAHQGRGGLTYMMINARVPVTDAIDVQGLYHHGRSIDARGITEDVLAGRPIPAGALDGFLFSSAGLRVTVRITRDLRVNAGYTRDQNNRDSAGTNRVTFGGSISRLLHTGLDVTTSVSRMSRPGGQYASTYASIGRQFGRLVYLSVDYSTSVSVLQFTGFSGVTVTTKPRTRQFMTSSVVNLTRHLSLLGNWEHTRSDAVSEMRVMTGFTWRF